MIFFALLAGALLAMVVAFVVPRARVRVVLATEPFVADLTVWLDTSLIEPQRATHRHPGRLLRVEETAEEELAVETVVEKGARAEGTVDLVNRTDAPQGIKTRTRLQSTRGTIVRTQRDVILPPMGRAAVTVQAEVGGTSGNVEPQRLSLIALPTESQRLLYGEIIRPLRGGTDQPVRQLAAADVERGSALLRERAAQRLPELVRTEAGKNSAPDAERQETSPFTRSELSRVVVGNIETSHPLGTEVAAVRLHATVRGEAIVADARSLRAFLDALIRQQVNGEKTLARELPLEDLRVVDVRWEEGRAELSLHVESQLVATLNLDDLKAKLRGRTASDAAAFLRAFPGVRTTEVTLSPVWVKRVPSLLRNVHVETATDP